MNLFTRPRRFGKTLNMSMLRYFFEDTGDKVRNLENQRLFAGLKIMEAENIAAEMGRYPVISLSLKSSKQPHMELAYACRQEEIAREFERHMEVRDRLFTEEKRRRYMDIVNRKGSQADFIRSLFESALKTNPSLEFAVITGCLRISKESIFTGLNNLNVISILSSQYGEHFGFLQKEVDQMLKAYDLTDNRETVKQWYDGYHFGTCSVYNPWSVINYVLEISSGGKLPRPY